ncbi:MAG: hypothetical protein AB7E13_07300 [Arcobacteraceae bacterium]
MRFVSPEANAFFKLAILIEKNIDKSKKEFERGSIDSEEYIELRKTIIHLGVKNNEMLMNHFDNFLKNKVIGE